MIKINEKYGIQADEHCYSVVERRVAGEGSKEPGREYFTPIGIYCPTVASCIKALMRRMQREIVSSGDMSLRTAYTAFNALETKSAQWLREEV